VQSIETRSSWIVATVALAIMALAFGAPWIIVVALKGIAEEVGGARSVPSLASSMAWFGSAVGGIVMGRIAEKVGVRWTVMFGGAMIGVGLVLSSGGEVWQLTAGHGLFIGLLGIGGINAPFYVYVSQWFDVHRGSALALISSGSYLAGAIWPSIFERAIAHFGWRQTMFYFSAAVMATIIPLAAIFLRAPPAPLPVTGTADAAGTGKAVIGWPPNLVFAFLAAASFLCCIPMSMPQAHLVAFCSDIGISRAHGAAMLSVLLGAAFVSRQVWGWISDRIGGLNTVLASSASQAAMMTGFLLTQDEIGLFAVAAAFGLGFGGLIPAYVLALRQLFPVGEAYWRIPALLLCSGSGMAAGGWLGGVLYDYFGFYGPAFAAGIIANIFNLALVGSLVWRRKFVVARA
jgi:MFS family permease